MSKSRSSTPVKKPPGTDTNIAAIGDPTTGPILPHNIIAGHSTISSRTAYSVISSTTPRVPSPHSSPKRGVVRKAEDELEGPTMAKRQRQASSEPTQSHREDSRSSPSSDSQSGMADAEVDQKKVGESVSPIGSTTQKKKRTRTLTTPHQAAVLHDLLAQSRFPTTAMREEVGRAIGLSARKVQIWFQNQRQKARRPRSQGDAPTPTTRSPQYGPYPTNLHSQGTYLQGMGAYPMTTQVRMPANPPYTVAGPSTLRSPDALRHEHYRSPSMNSGPPPTPPTEGERLLGPGMPGAHTSRHRPSRSHGRDLPTLPPSPEAYFYPSHRYEIPSSSTTSPPIRASLMLRPVTQQSHRREWDPSRTLPPLTQSRPSTSSHPLYHGQRPYPLRHDSPPPIMAPIHRRSTSPERRFAHQLPDLYSGSAASSSLPPPYTLQPHPRWNPMSHSADIRPSSVHSSWSRPGSRSANPLPVALHVGIASQRPDDHGPDPSAYSDPERTPQPLPPPPTLAGVSPTEGNSSPPPSRSGRYDPIREIFVPFTPTVSGTSSAARTPPNRDHEDKKVEDSSDEEEL